jgi:uncharacterized protein YbjT (DUF2867 family)
MTPRDPLYWISGATGNTAVPAIERLIGDDARVRASVHRIDARSQRLADLGAEVVKGDLDDFHSPSDAMTGVRAAYLCHPIPTRLWSGDFR